MLAKLTALMLLFCLLNTAVSLVYAAQYEHSEDNQALDETLLEFLADYEEEDDVWQTLDSSNQIPQSERNTIPQSSGQYSRQRWEE